MAGSAVAIGPSAERRWREGGAPLVQRWLHDVRLGQIRPLSGPTWASIWAVRPNQDGCYVICRWSWSRRRSVVVHGASLSSDVVPLVGNWRRGGMRVLRIKEVVLGFLSCCLNPAAPSFISSSSPHLCSPPPFGLRSTHGLPPPTATAAAMLSRAVGDMLLGMLQIMREVLLMCGSNLPA
jgi:hypothetical protein